MRAAGGAGVSAVSGTGARGSGGAPATSGPRSPRLWLVRTVPGGSPADPPGWSALSSGERERASALRRADDRALYVAAHAVLRLLLGLRLGSAPAEVPLTRLPCPGCGGPHGRPAVAGPAGAGLHFSLSRTAGAALLGVAAAPVGVDLERTPDPDLVRDATAALHPREQGELARLAPGGRAAAFARCWTRKEALLKATGEGLSHRALREHFVGTGTRPASGAGGAPRPPPRGPPAGGGGGAGAARPPPPPPPGGGGGAGGGGGGGGPPPPPTPWSPGRGRGPARSRRSPAPPDRPRHGDRRPAGARQPAPRSSTRPSASSVRQQR
ncbi:4'-phosphopantetheinyl transferase superfamily protein [Streptomyces sp. NPDC008150]|uniref:4'-phosphopantetheinyl transferase family protein n=1 Tax=Streptomyces sp. NPDC008150 TaxID=3364816 RepID=UPI0036E32398